MSGFDPRDADPLHHVDPEQDLWDPAAGAWVPRQSALAAILVALVIGIVAGVLLVFAISAIAGAVTAPRSAANAIPADAATIAVDHLPVRPSSGNPSQPSGAPSGSRVAAGPYLSAPASAESGGMPSGAPTPSPAADLKQSPAITPKPTKRPVTEPPAVESGIASWCAPTPTQCRRWGGTALLGAVHSFRWGDRPYRVTIHGPAGSTVVTIVSYCQCYFGTVRERLVDLSPAAFVDVCGRLSRGICPVSMELP